MKKLLVIAFGLLIAGALTVSAADKTKKEMTPEQQKLKTEMTTKYDANKDGKIDEQEAAKISSEDKAKMKEAGVRIGGGKKKK
jgi:L-serine deaminase